MYLIYRTLLKFLQGIKIESILQLRHDFIATTVGINSTEMFPLK